MNITAVYRGFSGGTGTVSALIRRLDRVKFPNQKTLVPSAKCQVPDSLNRKSLPPVINHVYRRFEFENGLSLITESHFSGGVQITPRAHLLTAIKTGKVTHCYEKELDLTPVQMRRLWNKHLELHGDSYDIGLIISYWTWLRLGRRRDSRRFERNKKNNKWTCNEYYVATAAGIEPDIPERDLRLTPEALFIKTFGLPSALYAARTKI